MGTTLQEEYLPEIITRKKLKSSYLDMRYNVEGGRRVVGRALPDVYIRDGL